MLRGIKFKKGDTVIDPKQIAKMLEILEKIEMIPNSNEQDNANENTVNRIIKLLTLPMISKQDSSISKQEKGKAKFNVYYGIFLNKES